MGFFWKSDRPIAETCRPILDNTKLSQETDIHTLRGIRSLSPSKRETQTDALDRAATGIGV